MICNILYRDEGERIVWRIDAHPTETRKHLEKRLKRFSERAIFIDYWFGELTDEENMFAVTVGRFPQKVLAQVEERSA